MNGPGLVPGLLRVRERYGAFGGSGTVGVMSIRARAEPWIVAVPATLAVLCLLLPWMRSGQIDYSTVDLLSSASALDLIGGTREVLILTAWFGLVLLAAGVLVAAAWGRRRVAALLGLPVGPSMVSAWLVVASTPFPVRWGAHLAVVFGLTATVVASVLLKISKSTEGAR